ncbi:hypothetical protein BH09MYX1_BH09MYX1_27920 [soil metagenome]
MDSRASPVHLESCKLTIADQLISRADVGAPEAELALVNADCLELRATEPGAVREVGYRTTVAEALQRLEDQGVTYDLAKRAGVAAHVLAPTYARGLVVRRITTELGPAELFEGRVYLSAAKSYEGAWLDLAALGFDLGEARVSISLQALHLVSVLTDAAESADVYLSTLAFTKGQRPGVRTLRRVDLSSCARLPELLERFASRASAAPPREAGPTRVEVLDWLASRMTSTHAAAERYARIEAALMTPAPSGLRTPMPISSRHDTPVTIDDAAMTPRTVTAPPRRGPLSDPVAWSIETQLSAGDVRAAVERISALERAHGRTPSVVYLRSRASLLARSELPEVIAQRLSLLAAKASFDELELLAAEAWMAAGNAPRALPYARVLAQNPNATEDVRGRARNIVATVERSPRTPPPQTTPSGHALRPTPSGIRNADPRTMPIDDDDDLPPVLALSSPPRAPTTRESPTEPPPATPTAARTKSVVPASDTDALMRGASRPAFKSASEFDVAPIGTPEVVEELDDPSRDSLDYEARRECVSMARELGRLYRMQHGIVLRTDVPSLEHMQSQLLERYHGRGVKTQSAALDVQRHGAVVAEMLARCLDARWTDVAPSELGYWEMTVPPGLRVWPFARVLRLINMGAKERDLVSYFLELYARSPGTARARNAR